MSLEEITESEEKSSRKFNNIIGITVGSLAAMYLAVGSYVLATNGNNVNQIAEKSTQNPLEAYIGLGVVAAATLYEIYRSNRMTKEKREMYERNSRDNFPYFWK